MFPIPSQMVNVALCCWRLGDGLTSRIQHPEQRGTLAATLAICRTAHNHVLGANNRNKIQYSLVHAAALNLTQIKKTKQQQQNKTILSERHALNWSDMTDFLFWVLFFFFE